MTKAIVKKHLQHSTQTLTLDSNSSYSTLQSICPQESHLSSVCTNSLICEISEWFLWNPEYFPASIVQHWTGLVPVAPQQPGWLMKTLELFHYFSFGSLYHNFLMLNSCLYSVGIWTYSDSDHRLNNTREIIKIFLHTNIEGRTQHIITKCWLAYIHVRKYNSDCEVQTKCHAFYTVMKMKEKRIHSLLERLGAVPPDHSWPSPVYLMMKSWAGSGYTF